MLSIIPSEVARCLVVGVLVIALSALSALAYGAGKPPEFPGAPPLVGFSTRLLPDGSWERLSLDPSGKTGERQLHRFTSNDHGRTWNKEQAYPFSLPGEGWGGPSAVWMPDNEVQLFFTHSRWAEEPGKPRLRYIDIHHARSYDRRSRFSQPKRVFEGYVGAMFQGVRLTMGPATGRIVLPFGMMIGERKTVPPIGRHHLVMIYSDDDGETFSMSSARLTSPVYEGYNGSNEGLCEPSIIQQKDGTVRMLMRTQTGVLYESTSEDGITWPDAWPSRFHASTGPPGLIRLPDDRLMLFWNSAEMPPRVDGAGVYGGRDALHAAIGDPTGTVWHGWREIYRDPTRNDSPPKKGDRGTAYPAPVPMSDGRVAVASGQGGRRALIYVDPAWLLETRASSDLTDPASLDEWCVYKGFGPAEGWWRDRTQGAALADHPDSPGRKALHLRRPDEKDPDGAVWNFPAGRAGRLALRVRVNSGYQGGSIALADRFIDPSNPAIDQLAIFRLPLEEGAAGAAGAGLKLEPGRWHDLVLQWDAEQGQCTVTVDGKPASPLKMQNKPPNGVCYVHLRSTAASPDQAGWMVERVEAELTKPPINPS